MTVATNLQYIKRSYAKPAEGDIFVVLLPTRMYLFGRVILANTKRGTSPAPGGNLLYAYRHQSKTQDVDESKLAPKDLLIPPFFTNKLGWTKGVMRTVEQRAISSSDLLAQHCFYRVGYSQPFVDETGTPLPDRTEPADREVSAASGSSTISSAMRSELIAHRWTRNLVTDIEQAESVGPDISAVRHPNGGVIAMIGTASRAEIHLSLIAGASEAQAPNSADDVGNAMMFDSRGNAT